MESRIFFPSYRYRRPIIFPCRPKARKPLASYMGRLTLQCELRNRQMFTEIHDLPEIQPIQLIPNKYESSTRQRDLKEKFSKKSSLAGFKNNCWLPQIKQVKKGFSYLSPILSFLFIAITGDIISEITVGIFVSGIIVGIFFSEVIAGIFFCI